MDYFSICLICKDENDYLPEWLDYHILMGVDRFYIYDNDSRVSLRQTLSDYIRRGWVVVLDIHGKGAQLFAYDHCLQTFGPQTRWMGFIDTDEFFVPKSKFNLKDLLKEYEGYGGLAVSSLFFGSNGLQERSIQGQIAGYTLRTHSALQVNLLVKCIIQPAQVLLPNSPHDFIFKENAWAVNEDFLRVDNQVFPNSTGKIQLNHYFCRSQSEMDQKLMRGRGDKDDPWPRKRFELVDSLATYPDTAILKNLNVIFQASWLSLIDPDKPPQTVDVVEKLALLAQNQRPEPFEGTPVTQAVFRREMTVLLDNKNQMRMALEKEDFEEVKHLLDPLFEATPWRIGLHVHLAYTCLNQKDAGAAWQALAKAWQIAPNSYLLMVSMADFFLRVEDYAIAEKTCRALLEMVPYDRKSQGFLTCSLLGLGRFEEAIQVGIPMMEQSAVLCELPDGVEISLIRNLAASLLQQNHEPAAVHVWEIMVNLNKGDVEVLLELVKLLLRREDKSRAFQFLVEAQQLAPQNKELLDIIKQIEK